MWCILESCISQHIINVEISETNLGKEHINKKYKLNFSVKRKKKDNSEKEILKYESLHQFEKEFDASISIVKHKIKDEIRKSSIPLDIKPKLTKFDEIPDESKYHKTVRNENFMIFKNPNLIIFQYPAPKFIYQYSNNITPKNFHCDFEKVRGLCREMIWNFDPINMSILNPFHIFHRAKSQKLF
ncbi:hypothetical protein U3516DRAFT_741112 [Neocallimastix sp. 'constans']